ncbi:diguanylate cyclase [Shewanella intestini]|uniref:diguanylate cyclase n=1 Tax=Shewanella intestini TaxID=2017544 RepID=A0ABS5I3C9_9GAMM|nr:MULTISPECIES: GGDEF domain-containing protein [Shewanella]MBR9728514.1 GGDEF domain-containing protein [Shewanella intestini]MRG36333.1 diguanylate cyclase [Shewanella sp. XMDDZSB0408]
MLHLSILNKVLILVYLSTIIALCAQASADQFEQTHFESRNDKQQRADVILLALENGITDQEEYQPLFNELETLLQPDDIQRKKRYVRNVCWYQPSNTTQEVDQAIAYADTQILVYAKPYPSTILTDLHLCRGWYKQLNSYTQSAHKDLNFAINSAYQIENPRLIADGRSIRGSMYSYQGNYSAALEDLITAQQLYESINMPYWATYNLGELAATYRRFGDATTALKYQKQLEQRYIDDDKIFDANELSIQIGYSLSTLKRYDEAIKRFKKSRQFAIDNEDPILAADMAISIASEYIKQGKFSQAKLLIEQEKDNIPSDFSAPYSYLTYTQAQLAHHENQPTKALKLLNRSLEAFVKNNNQRGISDVEMLTSQVHASNEQWHQAYIALQQYLVTHKKLDQKLLDERNAEMQARFDTSKIKRENQLLLKAAEAKEQRLMMMERNDVLQIIVIILSSIILVFLSIFAYKSLIKQRTFRQLALTDELTGLSNRRDTYSHGHRFLKQAISQNKPLSIISFDADHFKAVNDALGHDTGDKVLMKLAELTATMMRDSDIVGRVGGEEFLILLPNINKNTAVEIAKRLILTIEKYDWNQVAPGLSQTVSAGVSTLENETTLTPLLLKADKALYSAKASGRNCVVAE